MDISIEVIIAGLLFAIIEYCIFPLLFANLKRKKISATRYWLICLSVNAVICVAVNAMLAFSMDTTLDRVSFAPCLFWTAVFSGIGQGILNKKGLLIKTEETAKESSKKTDESTVKNSEGGVCFCLNCNNVWEEYPTEEVHRCPICGKTGINTSLKTKDWASMSEKDKTSKIKFWIKEGAPQEVNYSLPHKPSEAVFKVRYCAQCGAKLIEGAKYCRECGKQL